jgi:hypothetical protein
MFIDQIDVPGVGTVRVLDDAGCWALKRRRRSDPNRVAKWLSLYAGISVRALKRLPLDKRLEVRAAVLRLTSPANGLSPSD